MLTWKTWWSRRIPRDWTHSRNEPNVQWSSQIGIKVEGQGGRTSLDPHREPSGVNPGMADHEQALKIWTMAVCYQDMDGKFMTETSGLTVMKLYALTVWKYIQISKLFVASLMDSAINHKLTRMHFIYHCYTWHVIGLNLRLLQNNLNIPSCNSCLTMEMPCWAHRRERRQPNGKYHNKTGHFLRTRSATFLSKDPTLFFINRH